MSNLIKDVVQPEESRKANYKLLDAFNDFESVSDEFSKGTYGNIQNVIYPNWVKVPRFYDEVSAPMLLARLVSAGFTPSVQGQNGYKTTYNFTMRHKRSGCIVTFYDYKGASSFGACERGHSNKKFQMVLKKIIKALTNPRFPHPYDGCVVGEIA